MTALPSTIADNGSARSSALSLLERLRPLAAKSLLKSRSELPPKPQNARYESLTLWRGIACLMLLVYHAAFYADHTWRVRDRSTWTLGSLSISCIDRLSMGVPIFFVVSGYCIAASIDSLRRRQHSLRDYFWRRLRRIYPPLWAAYVLGAGVTLLVMASGSIYDSCTQLPRLEQFKAGNWIGNITASESWLPHLRGDHTPTFLLPNTWTLCYEEQFYVVTGLLLALAAQRFFAAAYLIALTTFVLHHVSAAAGLDLSGFFFDGLWIMFCGGILVYERINYLGKSGARLAMGVLVTCLTYGAAARAMSTNNEDRHFGERILAASAFAILLIYLHRWDSRIVRTTLLKPIAWCGKISYSVFLTHYPIVVLIACLLAMIGVRSDGMVFLITVPVCLAVSLPIAWLFHLAVERHFLNTPVEAVSGKR